MTRIVATHSELNADDTAFRNHWIVWNDGVVLWMFVKDAAVSPATAQAERDTIEAHAKAEGFNPIGEGDLYTLDAINELFREWYDEPLHEL